MVYLELAGWLGERIKIIVIKKKLSSWSWFYQFFLFFIFFLLLNCAFVLVLSSHLYFIHFSFISRAIFTPPTKAPFLSISHSLTISVSFSQKTSRLLPSLNSTPLCEHINKVASLSMCSQSTVLIASPPHLSLPPFLFSSGRQRANQGM